MPLVHMVLADHDSDYVNRLSQWFVENKAQQFKVSAFTERDSFEKFLAKSGDEIDVILAVEDFLSDKIVDKENTIILGQAIKFSHLSPVFIEKYQPAPSICADVLSVISKWENEMNKWYMPGKSKLIVCFSTDQQLKTNFALLLSILSHDYVYINFESFPFYVIQNDIQQNRRNLSDVLYHIKASKGNTVIALESSVIIDETNINYIASMDNPMDLWELSEKELSILIDSLKSWGHFTKVIVDIECNTSPMTIQWFNAASCIVIPFEAAHINQIIRLKNMFETAMSGFNTDKIRWVFCGNSQEVIFPVEIPNLIRFPWINSSMTDIKNISLDDNKKIQLENLFTYSQSNKDNVRTLTFNDHEF